METTRQILKSLNLLYAEDDDNLREATLRTLTLMFKNVYSAKDGVEALESYNRHMIDILMLDYVMPDIDGYELAHEIRKTNKSIPIIICSGFTEKEKLLNSIKIGAIKYIEKPLKFTELMDTMDQICELLKKERLTKIDILDNLSYCYINKVLVKDNNIEVPLSKKEISLIEFLLKKRSVLATQDELMYEIFYNDTDINNLRNVVYRLKKKVDLNFIITIKDLGYMIV